PEHARQVMLETLASVDILIPSYEDGQFLTGLDAPDKIAEELLARGPRAVILKLGGEGVLLMTPEGLKRLAPWRVRCVDTTGAGDTFAGAFLTARVEGRSWGECADFANAAAALSTTGCGAVAPIPKRTQVEAMLASRGDS
ncbi:MAG: carbohydrate kinase family protein, partial [Chloroflexi bacterium]|nr:carbohydrate kinase family protein [Chloroflexota bacterium]